MAHASVTRRAIATVSPLAQAQSSVNALLEAANQHMIDERSKPSCDMPPSSHAPGGVFSLSARQRAIARLEAIKPHVAAGSASTCARAEPASYRVCVVVRAFDTQQAHYPKMLMQPRCGRKCQLVQEQSIAAGSASSCKSRAGELPLSCRRACLRHAEQAHRRFTASHA